MILAITPASAGFSARKSYPVRFYSASRREQPTQSAGKLPFRAMAFRVRGDLYGVETWRALVKCCHSKPFSGKETLMSKGPGRIARAIANLLADEPEGAWTTEELCQRIYHEVSIERSRLDPETAVQKKHRVAVIRAANNIIAQRPEVVWDRNWHHGRTLILYRRDNYASAALAQAKTDDINRNDSQFRWVRRQDKRDASAAQTCQAAAKLMTNPMAYSMREVRRFLAERDGDTETVAKIDAAEEQIRKALFGSSRSISSRDRKAQETR
jgi:hypothetical protein